METKLVFKTTSLRFLCCAVAFSSLLSVCVVRATPVKTEEETSFFPDQKGTRGLPSIFEDSAPDEKGRSDALSDASDISVKPPPTNASSRSRRHKDFRDDYKQNIGELPPRELIQRFLGKGDKPTTLEAFFAVVFDQEARVMPVLREIFHFFEGSKDKRLPQAFKDFREGYEKSQRDLSQCLMGRSGAPLGDVVSSATTLCDAIRSAIKSSGCLENVPLDASLEELVHLLLNSRLEVSLPSAEEEKEKVPEEESLNPNGGLDLVFLPGTTEGEVPLSFRLPLLDSSAEGSDAPSFTQDRKGLSWLFPRKRSERLPLLSSQPPLGTASRGSSPTFGTFRRYAPVAMLMAGAFCVGQVLPPLVPGGK